MNYGIEEDSKAAQAEAALGGSQNSTTHPGVPFNTSVAKYFAEKTIAHTGATHDDKSPLVTAQPKANVVTNGQTPATGEEAKDANCCTTFFTALSDCMDECHRRSMNSTNSYVGI